MADDDDFKFGRTRILNENGVTHREQIVIDEYLRHGNKARAMRAAGYSEKTSLAAGAFKRRRVREAIEREQSRLVQRGEIDRNEVVEELKALAFFRLGALMDEQGRIDVSNLTDEQKAAIAACENEIELVGRGDDKELVRKVKIKTHDKVAALDKLARMLGLYQDNRKVDVTVTLRDRIQAGRERVAANRERRINAPKTIDAEYEEVEG